MLLPLLLGVLSACTATRSATTISAPRTVDASQAVIMPAPGGPTVISVIEERFSDAVEQKVVLGTDATNAGQNYLGIRMYGPMERETRGTKSLGYRSLTAAALGGEIARVMPGVAMKTSTLFLRNSYGPFGYAYGRTEAGDSCIYGWQQLRSSEAQRAGYRNAGAIQIRLRLCENGASEKELLAVMYGYTVTGSFSSDQWNPFGRPGDVAKTVGAGGDPIYPDDAELAAAPKIAPQPSSRRRPVAVERRNEEAVVEEGDEDESVAKRIVDVPAPAGIEDGASSSDNAALPDMPGQDRVVVPGPDCQGDNASCN